MSTVAYCQLTYPGDVELTIQSATAALGHVDDIIIAAHDCTPDQVNRLAHLGDGEMADGTKVHVVVFAWNDNFPEARNIYLERAKQLKMDWVLVSDADEIFNDELFKKLKPVIIPKLEAHGFNMAGVNCHEQFSAVEWMDDLEKLKESPGGYRESDFWKNLLFRIYPDTTYSGVGKMGNVHETWGSPTVPFNPINLPKTFWYTHVKSALQIWRNAARNFVIGGGGNNIGDANPMWAEFRTIMITLHLNNWDDVEKFVAFGPWPDGRMTDMKTIILPWVIKALTFSAADYGTETREAAKYIIYYNRWMLDIPAVKEGIANPPKKTRRDDLRSFVMSAYFQALGRHPDEKGLEGYVDQLDKGELRPQDLVGILKASEEHEQKFREQPSTLGPPTMGAKRAEIPQAPETFKINLPVNVEVQLTEETVVQTLTQSRTYVDRIKPRLDVGRFIESLVADPAKFYNDFYRAYNIGELDAVKFAELIGALGEKGNH